MATDRATAFGKSLEAAGGSWETAPAAAFRDVLEDVLEPPAVGTPLRFDGVSLPDEITQNPTPSDLEAAKTGVTPAELGVADYGTVALVGTDAGEEPASLYPDRHVAVLAESDLLPDMPAAFERLEGLAADGGSAVLATGPSATADMGGLVYGAHGPEEAHVVVLEDR